MTVVTILPDGRVIARAAIAEVTVPIGGGDQAVAVSMPELKRAEYVMQVNLNLSPSTNVTPHDVKIDGNARST